MKIVLTQPTYRSSIWLYIESSDLCIRIHTSATFDPYERLYVWLGQIRNYRLPTSMIIDEEGYGVELIADKVSSDTILFKIDSWMCSSETKTHLTTMIQYSELIKAFHAGIMEFIKNEYRSLDWSCVNNLGNINWGALIQLSSTIDQDWQKRLLMIRLGSSGVTINRNGLQIQDLWKQITNEQQWLVTLRDVLDRIAIMAAVNKKPGIQAFANLYRNLPVDIALGEVDSEWYQERRIALDKEYPLYQNLFNRQDQGDINILQAARLKILKIGQIVDGTILAIKPYGLFVDICGCNALLHITLISQLPIEQLDNVFKVGSWIRAMIIDLDIEKGRVSLSTSDLEVEPGDMLEQPWKVYETAEKMAHRYYQNVLSKQNINDIN